MKFLIPLCMLFLTTLATIDVNECTDFSASNNCTYKSHCINTYHSYVCLCKEGYYQVQDPGEDDNCLLKPCKKKLQVDILFVIAKPVRWLDYTYKFLSSVIRTFTLGPEDVRLAIYTADHSDYAVEDFQMKNYTTYDEIEEALMTRSNLKLVSDKDILASFELSRREKLLVAIDEPTSRRFADSAIPEGIDIIVQLMRHTKDNRYQFLKVVHAKSNDVLETSFVQAICSYQDHSSA